MTKFLSTFFALTLILTPTLVLAEDVEQAATAVSETITAVAEAPIAAVEEAPAVVTEMPAAIVEPVAEVVAPVLAEAPQVVAEAIPTDNLEFISGEISSVDEVTQSVVVKLYGETESGTSDKTLKVTVDSTTDITDGEQDRDLKSLTAGTEVDVEYDPATNKATYIFVY